jgi:hypothetical protein
VRRAEGWAIWGPVIAPIASVASICRPLHLLHLLHPSHLELHRFISHPRGWAGRRPACKLAHAPAFPCGMRGGGASADPLPKAENLPFLWKFIKASCLKGELEQTRGRRRRLVVYVCVYGQSEPARVYPSCSASWTQSSVGQLRLVAHGRWLAKPPSTYTPAAITSWTQTGWAGADAKLSEARAGEARVVRR